MENYLEFAYDAPHNETMKTFWQLFFGHSCHIFQYGKYWQIDEIVSQKSHKNTKNISQVQKILKMSKKLAKSLVKAYF